MYIFCCVMASAILSPREWEWSTHRGEVVLEFHNKSPRTESQELNHDTDLIAKSSIPLFYILAVEEQSVIGCCCFPWPTHSVYFAQYTKIFQFCCTIQSLCLWLFSFFSQVQNALVFSPQFSLWFWWMVWVDDKNQSLQAERHEALEILYSKFISGSSFPRLFQFLTKCNIFLWMSLNALWFKSFELKIHFR